MKALVTRITRMERKRRTEVEEDQTFNMQMAYFQGQFSVYLLMIHEGIDLVEREDCPDERTWLRIQADRAWIDGRTIEARAFDAKHIGTDDQFISFAERKESLWNDDCERARLIGIAAQNARERTHRGDSAVALRLESATSCETASKSP